MSDNADLQFERADFAQGVSPTACGVCASALRQAYYAVNGQPVCRACCTRIRQRTEQGSSITRGLRACGAGALAAVAGAILYYTILAFTGYEFGLIAIVVGLAVGKAVNWGGYGRGGWRYQTIAMALTYLAIVSAYVPTFVRASQQSPAVAAEAAEPMVETVRAQTDAQTTGAAAQPASEASGTSSERLTFVQLLIAIAILGAIVCAAPFLAGIQNVMGLVIIGIGLYEAWKFNRRLEWTITGPHAIAPAAAPARG